MFGIGTSYLCYQYVSISIKQRKADGSMQRGSLRNRGVQKVIANCVGPEVVTAVVRWISVFWSMKPCRRLKVDRRFSKHVASIFMVGVQAQQERLLYSLVLKLEATGSSETSVDIQHITRRYPRRHNSSYLLTTTIVRNLS
jgi:hypothetical protein